MLLSLKKHEVRNSRTAEIGKKEKGTAVCLVMAGKHHVPTAAAWNRTRRGLALCLPLPVTGLPLSQEPGGSCTGGGKETAAWQFALSKMPLLQTDVCGSVTYLWRKQCFSSRLVVPAVKKKGGKNWQSLSLRSLQPRGRDTWCPLRGGVCSSVPPLWCPHLGSITW